MSNRTTEDIVFETAFSSGYEEGHYDGWNAGFSDGYHKTDFPREAVYHLLDNLITHETNITTYIHLMDELEKLWEGQHGG